MERRNGRIGCGCYRLVRFGLLFTFWFILLLMSRHFVLDFSREKEFARPIERSTATVIGPLACGWPRNNTEYRISLPIVLCYYGASAIFWRHILKYNEVGDRWQRFVSKNATCWTRYVFALGRMRTVRSTLTHPGAI